MSDIKNGDRVKVTIEAVATHADSLGLVLHGGRTYVNIQQEGVTVEKVEPPVEVFKQGDTVRAKDARSLVFTLGRGGYLDHLNGIWNARTPGFTSEHYERVDLAESR